jgi:nicotinamide phosphoribosyltransferase
MLGLIAATDSYNFGHFAHFRPDLAAMQTYLVARKGYEGNSEICFDGFNYYSQFIDDCPITHDEIDFHAEKTKVHGLPIRIKALKNGTMIPYGNALATVETLDDDLAWLAMWIEPLLVKTWYPMTISTKSYYVKQMMRKWLEMSSDNVEAVLPFSYHNFGDRGSSSVESSTIGATAHLNHFLGTDNYVAVSEGAVGYSIPAAGHAIPMSWGRENEFKCIEAFVDHYKGSKYKLVAFPMDTYDCDAAVHFCTSVLREKIESPEYPTLVMRPDSGKPVDVINQILTRMEQNHVSYTLNSKGFKVFNKYRVIWGDGVTPTQINNIIQAFIRRGYSAENVAFGSGGDLMQNVSRDTLGVAYKPCWGRLKDGSTILMEKDPITDPGKKSRAGHLTVFERTSEAPSQFYKESNYRTVDMDQTPLDINNEREALEVVYEV